MPIVVTSIGLSPNTSNIPEFNDCQRLLLGQNYGPLVAVFAAEAAAAPGGLASMAPSLGVAVATIYSYDDAYAPLGIEKEFNCLYLFVNSPVGAGFRALMVKWKDENCPATTEATVGVPLRVVHDDGRHGEADIPPVARWDHTGDVQYIGVKCGAFWCNVGPMNSSWTPQPSKAPPASAGPERRLLYQVKGYHDQQRLAPPIGRDWDHVGTPGPDDWVRPSSILGTIVPEPGVGGFDDATYDNPNPTERWVKVATTYLEGSDVGAYREKYGFAQTPSPDVGNEVRLCDPRSKKCPDLPANIDNTSSCKRALETIERENMNTPGNHSSRWYAKVKPADGGGEVFRCVIRREHAGLPSGIIMPSTARWRWLLDDDSIWVPCIFSCCHLQGGF
jgi:hypothetical protein